MANQWASNFGECGAASGFFDIASVGSLNAGNYSSKLGWANGNGQALLAGGSNRKTVTGAVSEVYYHSKVVCDASGSDTDILEFREGTTVHVTIKWLASGVLRITTPGSVNTDSAVFARTAAIDLQVHVKISDTVGVVEIKVNGNTSTDASFSGDTRNGGTGIIDNIAITATGAVSAYQSDIVLNDTTGSNETSWTGAVRVVLAVPTAAGADGTQWTPNASTNLSRITDTIPGANDGDTTYNEDSTAGHKDFFTWGSAAFTGLSPQTIHFVRVKYYARAADGGSHTIRSFAKSTSTVNGATANLSSSYPTIPIQDVYYTDPSTSSAWASFTAISAAEFGYELVS